MEELYSHFVVSIGFLGYGLDFLITRYFKYRAKKLSRKYKTIEFGSEENIQLIMKLAYLYEWEK